MSEEQELVVDFEVRRTVGLLTLNNPPVGALSEELLLQLKGQLERAATENLKALVVRSSSLEVFGAGADLKLLENMDADGYRNYLDLARSCCDLIDGFPTVTIAAIDGLALGGGLELALACTFRVAGPNAFLGLPEAKLAMIPGLGGTQRLTALIGREKALDLLLSGRRLDSEESLSLGLVSRVTEASAGVFALEWAKSFETLAPGVAAALIECTALAASGDPAGHDAEYEHAQRLFAAEAAQKAIEQFVDRSRARKENRE